jgi:hypothetical protein
MRQGVGDRALFVTTCIGYLGSFFCLLTLGRAPRGFRGLAKRLRFRWLRRARPLPNVRPESGCCYLAEVPAEIVSDAGGRSRLVVFENGMPLASPHAAHDEVRKHGLGAYSHWNGLIYFSTSDNTDPRVNGRRYTYAEV